MNAFRYMKLYHSVSPPTILSYQWFLNSHRLENRKKL